MYAEHWKLKALPFENAPNPKFFYESSGHHEAVTRLLFSIQSRKAIAVITGDYGTGKTVVCQTVINALSPNQVRTAFLTNPKMDSMDITREIAYQLGQDIKSTSKYDVVHALNSLLDRHAAAGRYCTAIIDEAQLITDSSILEDLRLLLNYQKDGRFLLTLVLIGQTELNDTLRPIPQMVQRIGLRFHIPNLDAPEVATYIQHRLRVAGAAGEIFLPEAIAAVSEISRGNPREINALCDIAMLTAFLTRKTVVSPEEVHEAAQERSQR